MVGRKATQYHEGRDELARHSGTSVRRTLSLPTLCVVPRSSLPCNVVTFLRLWTRCWEWTQTPLTCSTVRRAHTSKRAVAAHRGHTLRIPLLGQHFALGLRRRCDARNCWRARVLFATGQLSAHDRRCSHDASQYLHVRLTPPRGNPPSVALCWRFCAECREGVDETQMPTVVQLRGELGKRKLPQH